MTNRPVRTPGPGERDQQGARAGARLAEHQRPRGPDPPGQRWCERRTDDPAQAGQGEHQADRCRVEAHLADQEDHQQRLVAGEPHVAQGAVRGQVAQVPVGRDEARALDDLAAQVGLLGWRRTTLRPAHPEQAQRRDEERPGLEQQAGDRADESGEEPGDARAGDLRRRLAAVEEGVGGHQLPLVEDRGQVARPRGLEEHRRRADHHGDGQQLRHRQHVQPGGQGDADHGDRRDQRRSRSSPGAWRGGRPRHRQAARSAATESRRPP